MSDKRLPPIGDYRTRNLRMFQAIGAGRVKHNPDACSSRALWEAQCLKPVQQAAFSESAIIADDIPAAFAQRFGAECRFDDVLAGIPAWRPPFEKCWVEMSLSGIDGEQLKAWKAMDGDGEARRLGPFEIPPKIGALGCFARTCEVNDPSDILRDYPEQVQEPGGELAVRWITELDIWTMAGDLVAGPHLSITLFLDTTGALAPVTYVVRDYDEDSKARDERDREYNNLKELMDTGDIKRVLERDEWKLAMARILLKLRHSSGSLFAMTAGLSLFGYAFGLMHCKNVVTPIATDADRKAEPRLPKSGVRYRILKIKPMMQRRGSLSDDAGEPQPIALHMVRGHFSDYRNGRGLFGKHRGLYWWSPHVRGDAKNGTVVKDYAPVGATP